MSGAVLAGPHPEALAEIEEQPTITLDARVSQWLLTLGLGREHESATREVNEIMARWMLWFGNDARLLLPQQSQ